MPDARRKRPTEIADKFAERFRALDADVLADVEREVTGAVYGMSGYTTLAQADALAAAVRLRQGMRVLDLGAGAGWPGLYLAEKTSCDVVLSDLPADGIRRAAAAAAQRQVAERCRFLRASADALPFASRTFDAVVHTDVLC